MAVTKSKLTGFDNLEQLLAEFPDKVEKKIIRGAVKQGAEIQLAAVKEEAPHKTGNMAESLVIKTKFSKKKGTVSAQVTSSNKKFTGDDFYTAFQDLGTEKLEPNPFFERGFERTKAQVLAVTADALKAGIEKETAKAARKAARDARRK